MLTLQGRNWLLYAPGFCSLTALKAMMWHMGMCKLNPAETDMVALPQKNVHSYHCTHNILTLRNFLSEMHFGYQPSGLTENLGQFHDSVGHFHPQIPSVSKAASLESVGTVSATECGRNATSLKVSKKTLWELTGVMHWINNWIWYKAKVLTPTGRRLRSKNSRSALLYVYAILK